MIGPNEDRESDVDQTVQVPSNLEELMTPEWLSSALGLRYPGIKVTRVTPVQRGPWYLDVGYHIASALTVEDRRAHEDELVRHYLDRLVAAGGTPCSTGTGSAVCSTCAAASTTVGAALTPRTRTRRSTGSATLGPSTRESPTPRRRG